MELIIMGVFMCIAFAIGRYTPKKEVPKIIDIKKAKKQVKEAESYQLDEATITMLENINNYDGTSNGQKDVPEEV